MPRVKPAGKTGQQLAVGPWIKAKGQRLGAEDPGSDAQPDTEEAGVSTVVAEDLLPSRGYAGAPHPRAPLPRASPPRASPKPHP